VGGSSETRRVDPGKNPAQHYDVRPGLNAYAVSACAAGTTASTELLRGECVSVVAGIDLARVPVPADESQVEGALALN